MENNILNWLQDWYKSNCDGDWEHAYGVTIETLDNPGWFITIDLKNTVLEDEIKENQFIKKEENDWFGWKVENSTFKASGDPTKLSYLLELFRKFVEGKGNNLLP